MLCTHFCYSRKMFSHRRPLQFSYFFHFLFSTFCSTKKNTHFAFLLFVKTETNDIFHASYVRNHERQMHQQHESRIEKKIDFICKMPKLQTYFRCSVFIWCFSQAICRILTLSNTQLLILFICFKMWKITHEIAGE